MSGNCDDARVSGFEFSKVMKGIFRKTTEKTIALD